MDNSNQSASPFQLAICYWGLTRSTSFVHRSHHQHLFGPMRDGGIAYRTFMHTWSLPGDVQRVWGKVQKQTVETDAWRLLAPHEFVRDNQSIFEEQMKRNWSLYWHRGARNWAPHLLQNHLCALESLQRAYAMATASSWAWTHAVFVRPDVMLLNDLPLAEVRALKAGELALVHSGSSLNDQWAAGKRLAAAIYANRIADAAEMRSRIVAEALLNFTVTRWRLSLRFVKFAFYRVRPDGSTACSQGFNQGLALVCPMRVFINAAANNGVAAKCNITSRHEHKIPSICSKMQQH
mmetsp:Transcript_26065/g.43040  ORF Transcript_26065/g.43040 Transcript_26065/m.43040 type:complete len:293 (+) Transcript_26065:105-983(+)